MHIKVEEGSRFASGFSHNEIIEGVMLSGTSVGFFHLPLPTCGMIKSSWTCQYAERLKSIVGSDLDVHEVIDVCAPELGHLCPAFI